MATGKEKNDPEDYVLHEVEHFRQRYNWDCGVSCVMMLLSAEQRGHLLDRFEEICAEEGFAHSTWTIDLCYLLKRFGIAHHMYTTVLGVNEDYKKQGYYSNIINLDRDRVKARFAQALANSISVSERATSVSSIVQHLHRHGPVIVLVDAGLLVCDLCKHNKLKAEFRRCFGGGYKGHYILALGASARSGKVLYRDPALSPRLCAVSHAALHRAKAAVGTDDDCIMLYTHRTKHKTVGQVIIDNVK